MAYEYQASGNLVKQADTIGQKAIFNHEYNELSLRIFYTMLEGSQNEYRYDTLRRMTKSKDPDSLIAGVPA